MLEFLRISNAEALEDHSSKMAQWIFESGERFFISLFGSAAGAMETLGFWVSRPGSEFSGLLATLALVNQKPVGMFIALAGADIPERRRADLLAMIKDSTPSSRGELKKHLETLVGLTTTVDENEFYIRTIAVDAAHRGRGIGRKLLEHALSDGRAAGFTSFRLDVDAANDPALKLYRSVGFETIHEGTAPAAGLHMMSLRLQD